MAEPKLSDQVVDSDAGGRKTTQQPYVFFRHHIRPWFPDPSFINLHYLYFIFTCVVTSLIFWGSSTPARSVSYVDSLFLCTSAMTEAGLNTVNLSELNTWQQIMLFLLIIIGSAIFVSSAILNIRKRAFEKRFAELAERRRNRLKARHHNLSFSWSRRRTSVSDQRENAIISGALRGTVIEEVSADHDRPASFNSPQRGRTISEATLEMTEVGSQMDGMVLDNDSNHVRFKDQLHTSEYSESRQRATRRHHASFFEGRGVGAHGLDNHPRNTRPMGYDTSADESAIEDDVSSRQPSSGLDKYVHTMNGYLGRNSQIYHLTNKERRKLGGIEYDAICLLSWVVPLYFILWQLLGSLGVGAWIWVNRPGITLSNGLDPFWTGAFFTISAFNNSGMALLDANATVFQTSYYVLLTLSLLILAGNTCFPPFLRLILWTMNKLIPENSTSMKWQHRRRTLQFCLDHPRRVYTNLFNSKQTWWLVFSLIALNGIDWLAFELLNLGNPVTEAIPTHFRVLDGLFQAFAVRSGGFYVVSIPSLRQGLLVLYVLMMYLSAFPVAMTIRNSNVYEERSLGLYAEDLSEHAHAQDDDTPIDEEKQSAKANTTNNNRILSGIRRTVAFTRGPQSEVRSRSTWTRQDFIRQQLRSQLGHDLWLIGVAVFMIQAIEQGQFSRDPVVFSTFNIIFEVISAYGTVGISTGVPWNAYSFSGAWHTASKLVLCVMMLRGRHRGLPVAIDRAVLMPDETLAWAEEEDAHKRTGSFVGGSASRSGHGYGPSASTVNRDTGAMV